jgi:hypothetical protein
LIHDGGKSPSRNCHCDDPPNPLPPVAAFAVFIILPIALLWTFIVGMKRKASDRPTGIPISFVPFRVIRG